MTTVLAPFSGGVSTTLSVTAANTTITVPAGSWTTMIVSMLGVTGDDIIFDEATTVAAPTPGTFQNGTLVQRGTVQSFAAAASGTTIAFTPLAAGGTIGITFGIGA